MHLRVSNAFAEKEFNDIIINFMFKEETKNQILEIIEQIFWIDEVLLTQEQENQLNCTYTFLKKIK